jgi:hypothetical protein
METQPDAAEARRALDEIAQVRTRAAARKRTPMWLWHALGLLSFAIVVSLVLPRGWGTWVGWLLIAIFAVVAGAVAKRTGFGPFEGTRFGRWGAVLGALPVVGLVIGAALAYLHGTGWWVLVVAGVMVYAAFVILGPISERHLGAPTQALS